MGLRWYDGQACVSGMSWRSQHDVKINDNELLLRFTCLDRSLNPAWERL